MSDCPSCFAELPPSSKFCGQCGHKLEAVTPSAPEAVASPPSRSAAETPTRDERRDVTVLFADVSGFTSMCERLDPEEVHTVMNECFDGLGRAIHEQEGYIDKYIGDNVMALFGAPVAHEDDPARACRAALEMQAFLGAYAKKCETKTGVALKMRIGINVGLVVAGGVGSDVRKDYSVMGDTVNLAARLESAAPPGGILVSEAVEKRTNGLFEFGPSSMISVKGKEHPVRTLQLLRQRVEAEVFDSGRELLPFIGRTQELGRCLEQWEQASHTHGWVETRGDMGLGKTRLVQEAQARSGRATLCVVATTDGCRRPFGLARLLIYAVVREVSGQRERVDSDEEFSNALGILGAGLRPFLSALWFLAAPSRLAVLAPDPDPESLRLTINQGMIVLLEEFAGYAPAVSLFVDSYHLADPASATLLESLVTRVERCPLPIVIASRGREKTSPCGEYVIHLQPLSDEHAQELLVGLVHGAEIPPDLTQNIVMRAGGVPSYLEEMVRMLVDDGVLTSQDDDAHWECHADAQSVNLPTSILAAMMSRLDRLEPSMRSLLCQCAVQGVEFAPEVAERVAQSQHDLDQVSHVRESLRALEQRGFISTGAEGVWCVFTQPLMQEACYASLLLRDRRDMHAKTADAFCAVAGGLHAVAPEVLAYHYERAEQWSEAAHASLSAGDRASHVFLNAEAIQRYTQAIELFSRIDQSSDEDRTALSRAHCGAAQVQLRVGGYADAEAHARAMADRCDRDEDRAEAERLLASVYLHTGQTDQAERLLHDMVSRVSEYGEASEVVIAARYDLAELAHRAGRIEAALEQLHGCRTLSPETDSLIMIRVDMLEGKILHTAGRYADATEMYSRAYEAAERIGSLSERARASNNMGNAVRDLGHYVAAHDYFSRALKLWERMGDVECIAGAQINLGNVAMSQGQFAEARDHHEQSLAACGKIGNVQGQTLAQVNLAILAIEEGNGPAAVASAEEALTTLGTSGNHVLRGHVLAVLGDGRLESHDAVGAQRTFSELSREYDPENHPLIHACAQRGLGRVALLQQEYEKACELLAAAIQQFEQLKRAQEAARTVMCQANALWHLGERERAKSDLKRMRDAFTEMHADRDAARVDQLLETLQSTESSLTDV